MSGKQALLDLNAEQLAAALAELGEPMFRARQVREWLLKGRDFADMANLPAALRGRLSERFTVGGVRILDARHSARDDTEKYLYELEDGNVIEGVKLSYHHGNTLCVSTQVGCRMGCAFCASTQGGLVRNLTAGEMLGQPIAVNARLGGGRQITNLVLMGSGEPLDNYENVVEFLRRATAADGLGISARNISLSTCGLPQGMARLAAEGLPVTLCLSLHSPDDAARARLMPAARASTVAGVVEALKNYVAVTGRRAIIEYALIDGVNDREEDARGLAKLLKGVQCHINLIPLNTVAEAGLRGVGRLAAERFAARLAALGLSATVRRTLGEDIEGACGQLRRSHLNRCSQ